MIYDVDIAKQIAKSLLQINAIILQPENLSFGRQNGTHQYTVTIEKHYLTLK